MLNVEETRDGHVHTTVQDPPVAGLLFQSSGAATWLWLVVRVWLGYQSLSEGWRGLTSVSSLSPVMQMASVAQVLVGLALMLGCLVGFAATAAVLANMLGYLVW